jgi:hypothetical protein
VGTQEQQAGQGVPASLQQNQSTPKAITRKQWPGTPRRKPESGRRTVPGPAQQSLLIDTPDDARLHHEDAFDLTTRE